MNGCRDLDRAGGVAVDADGLGVDTDGRAIDGEDGFFFDYAESLRSCVQRIVEERAFQFSRVGSSRVDLQACKLEYSIVSPK